MIKKLSQLVEWKRNSPINSLDYKSNIKTKDKLYKKITQISFNWSKLDSANWVK